jgi:APA family basic amino acid/polyamine antiporter
MFALSTTLNATLGWVTKPLLQATVDGWFPKVLSKTTKKNKVPFVLLTIFYLIGAIPILTGWNIGALANFVMVLYNFIFIFLSIAVIRIDKVIPEIWKNSKWKVSKPVLYACGLLGALAGGIQVFLLITDATINQAIGNIIILSFAIVYAHFRQKTGNINMEISYEEA